MPGVIHLLEWDEDKWKLVGTVHFVWSAGMLTGNLGGGCLINFRPELPFFLGALFCAGAWICGVGLYRGRGTTENIPAYAGTGSRHGGG